jgi:flagellar L-ring protein precursor FlgH
MHPRHALIIAAIATGLTAGRPAMAQSKDAPPPRRISSWTADRRDFQVGDIITINLDEITLATASTSQNGSDAQTRQNDAAITPPKIGKTPLPAVNAEMNMGKQSSSKQAGDAARKLAFQGEMSVRVIALDAKTGLVQIKGTKAVDVDKNKQTMTFTGWLRPQDVPRTNIVESNLVADAQLDYTLNGQIGKTRGGILGRLLSSIWP